MSEKRDLTVDLDLCEKATLGPWEIESCGFIRSRPTPESYITNPHAVPV